MLAPALYALLESGLSEQYQFSNTSAIALVMTGDESDGTIYGDWGAIAKAVVMD